MRLPSSLAVAGVLAVLVAAAPLACSSGDAHPSPGVSGGGGDEATHFLGAYYPFVRVHFKITWEVINFIGCKIKPTTYGKGGIFSTSGKPL